MSLLKFLYYCSIVLSIWAIGLSAVGLVQVRRMRRRAAKFEREQAKLRAAP